MKHYLPTLSACALAIAVVCATQPVQAATATTTFTVTATVAASCTVSATTVAFGTVNPLAATAATANGSVTATCTNGTTYTIALSAGSGTFATRTMKNGAATLNYNLYSSNTYTNVLGDGTGSTVLIGASTPSTGTAGTGNGLGQVYTVYGQLPLPQATATVGSYTDTINVTLTY